MTATKKTKHTTKPITKTEPTAQALKGALWETLNGIRAGQVQASDGDAIASQAREILRTVRTQAAIARQANRPLAQDVISFAEDA